MSDTRSPGITETVARFACGRSHPTEDRVAAATRSLVDVVGVALAGRETPAFRAVSRWADSEPTTGTSVVWGAGIRRGAAQAALLNGTAGHALDFDDACPSMPLHPSTVLWPALLAVVRDDGTEPDPTSVSQALDVGNAVLRAIGEALPMATHYERGWHSTSTVGRLAAVAALARLRGLDMTTTRHALGVVASMAAGSLANFGTATKPLHAGLAARDAVVAVSLAEHGLDAAPDQLEHRSGFLALFGAPDRTAGERLGERLEHWERDWPHDWSLKRYPSCYGTHRSLDAVLELREEIDPAEVESVEVWAGRRSLRPLLRRLPTSGLEAKFSLHYTVATTLLRGAPGITDFTDAALADPTVRDLMRRVHVHGEDIPPDRPDLAGQPYALVRVRLTGGATAQRLVLHTRGDARNPLTDAEIDDKFRAAAGAGGYAKDATETLLALLRRALVEPGALAGALAALRDNDSRSERHSSE